MKPIRELSKGPREARELGREAQANDETFYECCEEIAHYYGKTWAEMTATEKDEARREFNNGKREEKEANL